MLATIGAPITAAFWLVAWLLFDKVLRLAWPRQIFDIGSLLPF